MKTIVKLVMLLAVLVICMPAQGDILIFNKSVKSQGAELTDDVNDVSDVYTETNRGFLVLEVTYDANDQIESVDNAAQVEYGITSRTKWATRVLHDFEISRYTDGSKIIYSLSEVDSTDDDFDVMLLQGKAKNVDIGNADANEAPVQLCGRHLYRDGDDAAEMCNETMRLNRSLTKSANGLETVSFANAYALVQAWLSSRNYTLADLPS